MSTYISTRSQPWRTDASSWLQLLVTTIRDDERVDDVGVKEWSRKGEQKGVSKPNLISLMRCEPWTWQGSMRVFSLCKRSGEWWFTTGAWLDIYTLRASSGKRMRVALAKTPPQEWVTQCCFTLFGVFASMISIDQSRSWSSSNLVLVKFVDVVRERWEILSDELCLPVTRCSTDSRSAVSSTFVSSCFDVRWWRSDIPQTAVLWVIPTSHIDNKDIVALRC